MLELKPDVTIKCRCSNPWRGAVWELTVNIETFALSSTLTQFNALLKHISSADNNLETLARIKEILEFLVSDENFSSFPVDKKRFKKYLDKMEVIKLLVTIAHAVCDERGRTSGGAAGNQTANLYHTTGELRFSEWYNPNGGGWDYLIRPKKKAKAIAIVSAAMSAVRNTKIGYDQADRESLYDTVQYKNFDPAVVDKTVNCDCSSLVTVCCNYAGIPILRGTYTGNLKERCEAVGCFKIYKSAKYTQCSIHLKDGDILLRVGHHAAVVVNTLYHMYRYLKIGTGGVDVMFLQDYLNMYNDANIKVDGTFGIHTDNALRAYQLKYKLETDGIMGPLTAAHMGFLWR